MHLRILPFGACFLNCSSKLIVDDITSFICAQWYEQLATLFLVHNDIESLVSAACKLLWSNLHWHNRICSPLVLHKARDNQAVHYRPDRPMWKLVEERGCLLKNNWECVHLTRIEWCNIIWIIIMTFMLKEHQPCFIIIFSETNFISMTGLFFKDTIRFTGTFSWDSNK